MSIPVNEEYIAELTRALGDAYMSVKNGVGDVSSPGTAVFELNQLSSLASKKLPAFGLLSSRAIDGIDPFTTTWSSSNPSVVTVQAGYVGYNLGTDGAQKVLVYTQDVIIKKAFSAYYDNTYRYGVRLGIPLSEIQKATSVYNTVLSATVAPGDQYVKVADISIADTLGFPLKANIGNTFVIFSDYNSDKTMLKIDPSFNSGGGFPGSVSQPAATRVFFIYEPRVQSVIGLPVSLTLVNTYDPAVFPYMPKLPSSWLPVADFVVTNPLNTVSNPTLGSTPYILDTTIQWPDPNDFTTDPPIFSDADALTIERAVQSTIGSVKTLSNNASVGDVINALESYTTELSGTNNISFAQYWGTRPFVGTTFFTHGVSFANIERFEFTKEFAQAYYDSKGKDVQHTFAIFRGDAYTYGNSTITPVYSAPSNVSVRASITNAINSPFTRGSYVYGVSAVYANGESAPVYGSVVTNSSNTYYINDVQFPASSVAPLFYNVYRKSTLVGDTKEWRITQPYDIIKPMQWHNNLVDNNPATLTMSHAQEAIQVVASSTGCLGGVGVLIKAVGAITNAAGNQLTVSLYTDSSNLPGTKIADANINSVIPYASLKSGFSLFVVNFDRPLPTLTSAAKYWIVITQSSAPTGGTIALGGWTGGNKDISGNTLSAVSDIHAYYSSGAWHTGDGQTRYFQLYGLIDNNITGYSLNHRGLFVTGRTALIPTNLRVYVPPIDPTTIMVGRSPGVLSVDDANAALGTADSDTRTVNDLIVNVTAYNTKTQKSGNYTVLVPQGTTRDTEFLIGTSADVFDSITDIQVYPGTNVQTGPNGAILWSIYDLITVENKP